MRIDVSHIAKLANLPLTEEEKKKFEEQLAEVVEYIKKLQEIDTKNVEPTSQITGLKNIQRTDIAALSLSQKEALSNAPVTYNGFFQVKGVLPD